MPNQIQPGVQAVGDNAGPVNQRGDNYGATVVQEGGGYYQELVRRGYGFVYSQAATGIAIAVPGSGAKTNFMIWNSSGGGPSPRLFVPLKITLGLVSTTAVLGNVSLYSATGLGSNAGTGAPVVSYTAATPVNALVGSTIASAMSFAPGVENLTTAPTFLKTLGWSILANDLSAKTTWNFETDLQGSLIFMPGTAMIVAASTAIASVCVISCFGVEIPIPVGM
jgi:hypothetical protein